MAAFGETIFAEMTRLAEHTGAINLGQGFPDTDGPPFLLAEAALYGTEGVNQQTPGYGREELRTAIAGDRQERYGLAYHPAPEVSISVGATAVLAVSVCALVEPGDEVVL